MSVRSKVVVVDDQIDNRMVLEDVLSAEFDVVAFEGGDAALDYLLGGGPADLVLLDIVLYGINGFEVCRRLKSTPATAELPVIFITGLEHESAEERGLLLGARDFVHKPFSPPLVLARVRTHVQLHLMAQELRARNEDLGRRVAERTEEVRAQGAELLRRGAMVIAAQSATISAFCSLAEARDNETGNHIRRTQSYVRLLAQHLAKGSPYAGVLDDEVIDLLYRSAPLHDIGKVAIPDAILLKPGRLTAEEWVVMKRHCEYGMRAIRETEGELGDLNSSFLRYARQIAYSHHERWDGTGYPEGLKGDQIPLAARLMAVADVYDALTTRRVYKPAMPHAQAMELMRAERGTHFEPLLIDALGEVEEGFYEISQRLCDEPGEAEKLAG